MGFEINIILSHGVSKPEGIYKFVKLPNGLQIMVAYNYTTKDITAEIAPSIEQVESQLSDHLKKYGINYLPIG